MVVAAEGEPRGMEEAAMAVVVRGTGGGGNGDGGGGGDGSGEGGGLERDAWWIRWW